MDPRIDRSTRHDRLSPSARLVGGVALLSIAAIAAAVAPPATPETIGRATLLDALAPALAARGATAVVAVTAPDVRRTLDHCNRMEGFMPPGSRLAGRTVVGVRCVDGANWQVLLPATIRVDGSTWQTTRALRPGESINVADLVQGTATLTAADLDAAVALARSGPGSPLVAATRGLVSIDGRQPAPVGRVALRSVASGRPLTAADVRDEGRINPGDPVRVVYLGDGFSVSSEGRAVGGADPGGNVTIRLASGATVNGTLRSDHLVELPR